MPKKNTALATLDNFRLVDRYAGLDPEMLEELRDQMDDLDAVIVPVGGGGLIDDVTLLGSRFPAAAASPTSCRERMKAMRNT